nr:MAG TPA: hypothetical protein [Caudoviricetes sp.]
MCKRHEIIKTHLQPIQISPNPSLQKRGIS